MINNQQKSRDDDGGSGGGGGGGGGGGDTEEKLTARIKRKRIITHTGFGCSVCQQNPILGFRWHCTVCYRFDLCNSCHHRYPQIQDEETQLWREEKDPASGKTFYYHTHRCVSQWDSPHDSNHIVMKIESEMDPPGPVGAEHRGKTVYETLCNAFRTYPHRRYLGCRRNSESILSLCFEHILESRPIVEEIKTADGKEVFKYEWWSYKQVWTLVKYFGRGMSRLIAPRSFVAIFAPNRREWAIADHACNRQRFITAPIDTKQDQDNVEVILRTTQSLVVICSQDTINCVIKILEKEEEKRKALSTPHPTPRNLGAPLQGKDHTADIDHLSLALIIMMDPLRKDQEERILQCGVQINYFDEILRAGKDTDPKDLPNNGKSVESMADELYTITYTSGSTGLPKGAMFFNSTFNDRLCVPYCLPYPPVTMAYCSFAHTMDRNMLCLIALYGGSLGLFCETMDKLLYDFEAVKPTFLSSTPHLFNQLFAEFRDAETVLIEKYAAVTKEKGGNSSLENSFSADPGFVVEREQLLDKIRGRMGGQLETVMTGGASTSPFVMLFLKELWKGKAFDGYGITEVGTVSSAENQVKLVNVPEMGYFASAHPPRGEIAIKSPLVFNGYFQDEKSSTVSFTEDGFFLTGDIGELDATGALHLIDRKKSIFKLAQGKFIAPEKIEGVLIKAASVMQIFICGRSEKSHLVAIVVPNLEFCQRWTASHGISLPLADSEHDDPSSPPSPSAPVNDDSEALSAFTLSSSSELINVPLAYQELCSFQQLQWLCQSAEFINKVLEDITNVAIEENLQPIEIPKAVFVHPEPFSKENGLLTTTMKTRRLAVEKRFSQQINQLYEETASSLKGLRKEEFDSFSMSKKLESILLINMGLSSMLISSGAPLALDSLSAARLVSLVSSHFAGVSLDFAFVLHDANFHSLVAAVEEKLLQAPFPTFLMEPPVQSTYEAEERVALIMERDLLFNVRKSIESVSPGLLSAFRQSRQSPSLGVNDCQHYSESIHHVLLTGVTGFIGLFLLQELLLQGPPDLIIHCLVRAESSEKATLRVESLLDSLEPFSLPLSDLLGRRIRVYAGDVGEPHFGLNIGDYEYLQHSVDSVYHSAATVNSLLSYSRLRGPNTLGTLHVLQFCCASKIKPLFHISTVGVLGGNKLDEDAPIFPLGELDDGNEDDDDDDDDDDHENIFLSKEQRMAFLPMRSNSGYNQSKWMAEVWVKKAEKAGLPVLVFRPNMISGHSRSGYLNPNDFFNRLLRSFVQLGCFPTDGMGSRIYDITPVDFLSNSIIYLSLHSPKFGATFNFSNHKKSRSIAQLGAFVASFGFSCEPVPYETFYQRLQASVAAHWSGASGTELQEANALHPLLSFLSPTFGFDPEQCHIATSSLDRLVPRERQIDISEQYIHTLMAYLVRIGSLQQPSSTASDILR